MADKTIIKLNNIPHGFYEKEMKRYFRQFGKVKNVLLVRSQKTHKSRGFGFVEFELPQVALAAAEAMHNYLFFNQVLKCRQMKRSDLPKNLFRSYKGPTSVEINKCRHNVEVRDQKNVIKNYEKITKVKKVKIDPLQNQKRSKRRKHAGGTPAAPSPGKEATDQDDTKGKDYNEIVGSLVANKFRLIKLLGSGSYGAVYLGKNLVSGELVAVKLEQKATKAPQLPLEYRFIKMIGPVEGFPRIIKIDECANLYHAMVMELLGPSLEEVFNACERKLSLKSVLHLSLQLLARFQTLHAKNIIYRDVKPENFLLGRPGLEKENIVHIIDYGLAKEYINPESGTHIAFRGQKGAIGTARYMSVNTHMGREQSRRDDLEALGYVLVYFMRGSLPWQGLPATDHKERMRKIGDMKKRLSLEEICDKCPEEFISYLKYVKHLDFYEAPDYDYLRKLFFDLLVQNRFVDDGIYDWTGKFEPKTT